MEGGSELSSRLGKVRDVGLEHPAGSEGLNGGVIRMEETVHLSSDDNDRVWE